MRTVIAGHPLTGKTPLAASQRSYGPLSTSSASRWPGGGPGGLSMHLTASAA